MVSSSPASCRSWQRRCKCCIKAEVTYAGPAPTLIAGVIQVNFRLPTFTGTSEARFQFVVGGWASGDFVVLVE